MPVLTTDGYTMDIMYFSFLSTPFDVDRSLSVDSVTLADTITRDCSQNYTTGI